MAYLPTSRGAPPAANCMVNDGVLAESPGQLIRPAKTAASPSQAAGGGVLQVDPEQVLIVRFVVVLFPPAVFTSGDLRSLKSSITRIDSGLSVYEVATGPVILAGGFRSLVKRALKSSPPMYVRKNPRM